MEDGWNTIDYYLNTLLTSGPVLSHNVYDWMGSKLLVYQEHNAGRKVNDDMRKELHMRETGDIYQKQDIYHFHYFSGPNSCDVMAHNVLHVQQP